MKKIDPMDKFMIGVILVVVIGCGLLFWFTQANKPTPPPPVPPTDTAAPPTVTPLPPTVTVVPPTATELPTVPAAVYTDTPVPPTATPVPPTKTPRPTRTPRPSPTLTNVPDTLPVTGGSGSWLGWYYICLAIGIAGLLGIARNILLRR